MDSRVCTSEMTAFIASVTEHQFVLPCQPRQQGPTHLALLERADLTRLAFDTLPVVLLHGALEGGIGHGEAGEMPAPSAQVARHHFLWMAKLVLLLGPAAEGTKRIGDDAVVEGPTFAFGLDARGFQRPYLDLERRGWARAVYRASTVDGVAVLQ
jgi:hypothetical protein